MSELVKNENLSEENDAILSDIILVEETPATPDDIDNIITDTIPVQDISPQLDNAENETIAQLDVTEVDANAIIESNADENDDVIRDVDISDREGVINESQNYGLNRFFKNIPGFLRRTIEGRSDNDKDPAKHPLTRLQDNDQAVTTRSQRTRPQSKSRPASRAQRRSRQSTSSRSRSRTASPRSRSHTSPGNRRRVGRPAKKRRKTRYSRNDHFYTGRLSNVCPCDEKPNDKRGNGINLGDD